MLLYQQFLIILHIAIFFCFNFKSNKKTQVETKKNMPKKSLVNQFAKNCKAISKNGTLENYLLLDYNKKLKKLEKKNKKIQKLTDESKKKLFDLVKTISHFKLNSKMINTYFNIIIRKVENILKERDVKKKFKEIQCNSDCYYKSIKKQINNTYDKLKKGELLEFKLKIEDMVKEYKKYYNEIFSVLKKGDLLLISKFENFAKYYYIINACKICYNYKEKHGGKFKTEYKFIMSLAELIADIYNKNKITINHPMSQNQLDDLFGFRQGNDFFNDLYDDLVENCKEEINIIKEHFTYRIANTFNDLL